jgi:hypothetical protein
MFVTIKGLSIKKRGNEQRMNFNQKDNRKINNNSDEDLYHNVRLSQVSSNCEFAAIDYFKIVSSLCPSKPEIAHSIMRIAIRPLFYLGICEPRQMTMVIEKINKGRKKFLKWLEENANIIEIIIKELTICCFFYDMNYNNDKNLVVLNHKRKKEMSSIFVEIQDKNMYEEFSTFDSFRIFFHSLFNNCSISQNELDRLILEEDYKNKYFSYVYLEEEL